MNINQTPFPSLFFGEFEYSDGGWIEKNSIHVYYPLQWLILDDDQDNRKMLLLSKDFVALEGFANCPILGTGYKTSWKDSYVRQWLNEYFFTKAFNNKQKSAICTTQISPTKQGHRKTLDRIFLLSKHEYEKYFADFPSKANYLSVIKDSSDTIKIVNDDYWSWWLRDISPDDDSLIQAVSYDGELYYFDSNSAEVGVRPAMWIKY